MSGYQTHANYGPLVDVEHLEDRMRFEALEKLGFAQILNPDSGAALGRNNGDTVVLRWMPQMQHDASPIAETDRVPRASVTPVRTSFTVKEYGQAIPWTQKLSDLADLDVEDKFIQLLADAIAKIENELTYNEAVKTDWKYVFNSTANEFVTNGTPTVTQNEDLTFDNLCALTSEAEERNIPFWDGENYVLIASVRTLNALQTASDVTTIISRKSPESALNKEVGIIGNARLVKDNQASLIQTSTGSYKESFLFGADAILKEVAVPPMLHMDSSDFGRFQEVAFTWLAGYHKVLDQTDHGYEHIVHVTSA